MPSTSSTFIYAGNAADADTFEGNYTNENPSVFYQTYEKTDLQNVTVIQNDDDGNAFIEEDDFGQTPDTFTYDVGAGSVTSALDNVGRYSVNYVNQSGSTLTTRISIYQTQNGDIFFKFPNGLQINSVTVLGIVRDGFGDITYGTSSTAVVACYASGTMIDTPNGPRPVQELLPGEEVTTLDSGKREILWNREAPNECPGARPILIKANALGDGCPRTDMIVSPQHRILVGGQGQLQHLFDEEVFVPAKSLVGLPNIRELSKSRVTTWHHFACDEHHVISANGCLSESLLLGPMVVQSLSRHQREALFDYFGAPDNPDAVLNGPMCRPFLGAGQVKKQLMRKQLKTA